MTTSKGGRPRKSPVQRACDGAWEGTDLIAAQLIRESKYQPCWRPTRAGAALGYLAATGPARCWMTTDQFAAWIAWHGPVGSRGGSKILQSQAGIGPARRNSILKGEVVEPIEALALAHYALQLPLPVEAGDIEGFNTWVTATFGGTAALTALLHVNHNYIADRMRGYATAHGRRNHKPPEAAIIRALDWIRRMGPTSPYGYGPDEPTFPTAKETT